MESIQCYGLWVPKTEHARWEQCGEFEGLPNLDVKKAADCAAFCTSLDAALDMGAHFGAVSVYLSRKFRKVFAFEAVPSTFEFLRKNAEALPNVEALNLAVGSQEGEVYFAHYNTHGQLSHVASKEDQPKVSRVGR